VSKTSISGVIWGNEQYAKVTREETKDTQTQQDERRAQDLLSRGLHRARRNSNGEGFGE